jgi:hypothetical protein
VCETQNLRCIGLTRQRVAEIAIPGSQEPHLFGESGLKGRGIGSMLAKEVLEAVRAESRTAVPQCEFMDNYIDRHPEYQGLVASGHA